MIDDDQPTARLQQAVDGRGFTAGQFGQPLGGAAGRGGEQVEAAVMPGRVRPEELRLAHGEPALIALEEAQQVPALPGEPQALPDDPLEAADGRGLLH